MHVHTFDFVYNEENTDTVIIYSVEREFYLRISSTNVTLSKTLNPHGSNNNNNEEKVIELYTGAWIDLDSGDFMIPTKIGPLKTDVNGIDCQYYGYYGSINERDDSSVNDGYLEMDRESLWKREISLLLDKVCVFFLIISY
jgi:hypothetical protein